MNNVNLIGNLGNDPESFYTDSGVNIVSYSLAFRSTKKDKTNWIKIIVFNEKLCETSMRYLHSGARIAVSGRLDQNKWVDDNNNTRTNYKVIASQITFIKTDGRGCENKSDEDVQDTDDLPF